MKMRTTQVEARTKPSGKRAESRGAVWLWLTAPVAVLAAIAALSELFVPQVFRGDTGYLVVQAVGQDVVTLAVALPALAGSAILAARGSGRARLVWLGVLVYLVYTYAIYAFQVNFNPLFLVYVGLLGCSLYALIGGLATTDTEGIKARFGSGTPIKTLSIFLATVAAMFYLVWLGEALPAVLSGGVPQGVVDNGTPTSAVHVLDMACVLPAMILTSVWLRKRTALGYVLAGALVTFLALLAAAIVGMMVAMWAYGQPLAIGMAVGFCIVSVISLVMLIWYLRGLREGDTA